MACCQGSGRVPDTTRPTLTHGVSVRVELGEWEVARCQVPVGRGRRNPTRRRHAPTGCTAGAAPGSAPRPAGHRPRPVRRRRPGRSQRWWGVHDRGHGPATQRSGTPLARARRHDPARDPLQRDARARDRAPPQGLGRQDLKPTRTGGALRGTTEDEPRCNVRYGGRLCPAAAALQRSTLSRLPQSKPIMRSSRVRRAEPAGDPGASTILRTRSAVPLPTLARPRPRARAHSIVASRNRKYQPGSVYRSAAAMVHEYDEHEPKGQQHKRRRFGYHTVRRTGFKA